MELLSITQLEVSSHFQSLSSVSPFQGEERGWHQPPRGISWSPLHRQTPGPLVWASYHHAQALLWGRRFLRGLSSLILAQ